MLTQQYIHKQQQQQKRDGNNLTSSAANNILRPSSTSTTEISSQATSVTVNGSVSNGNANHLRGSGINRMSCKILSIHNYNKYRILLNTNLYSILSHFYNIVVSELIMKEKLQKCSSSTGSETSEDGGLPPRSVGTKNLSELGKDVGTQNQQNSSQHSVRYLPLNMSLGVTSNVKSEFNKSPPPSPASSTSRIQPSTSSASSSSLSSDSPKGLYYDFNL